MGHIALITTDSDLTRVTLNAVHKHAGLHVITTASITDYKIWARSNHAHGVMIDMKTLLRGDHDERFYLNELSKFLPVAKIRCVPGKEELTGSFEWEGSRNDDSEDFLIGFVNTLKRFEESLMRRDSVRKPVILNLRIQHPEWKEPLLSVSVNVSMGGLFLITALPLPKDKWLGIELADFPHLPRVRAEIRWHLPWGRSRNHYPGFGVQFHELTEMHRILLAEL